MARWNTYFLIRLITIWNYCNAVYGDIKNKCQNMYYYLKDYFYGYHDMWVFIPGHSLPLSLNNMVNIDMVNIRWLYDNYDNTFILSNNSDNDNTQFKFSWLSAKIQVVNSNKPSEAIEYTIDDFIEKFTVYTNSNITPSLYMLFMCWCAHTKHWFNIDDNIEFHIIDDMGEEHHLNSYNDNKNSIIIKRNKLYVVNDTKDDTHIETTNTIIEGPTENTPLKEDQDKKDE